MEATPLGRIFLARAEEIIKAAAELKREIDLARGLEIGQLEIGSGVGPAELLMGTAIGRLSQRYPHLYMHVRWMIFRFSPNSSNQVRLSYLWRKPARWKWLPIFW